MNQQESSYFADATSLVEVARLVRQDRLLTEHIGGLFPDPVDRSKVHTVLDIACGPGGWALDVAHELPQASVTGIDISPVMVSSAQRLALAESSPNATFLQMDARQLLAFPDTSFDFVNARLIQSFMTPTLWKNLLSECFRVVSRGGWVRVTEHESSYTTAPANDEMIEILFRSLWKAGRTFSPRGRSYCLSPVLRHLITEAGFAQVGMAAYALDVSHNSAFFPDWLEDFVLMYRSLRPFILQVGVASEEELDRLYDQARREMEQDDYCGITYIFSCWGKKPIH